MQGKKFLSVDLYSPKIKVVQVIAVLAGLLAHLNFPGLPITNSGHTFRKIIIQVYSSGDCSGFSPDSHFKGCVYKTTAHQLTVKVENYSVSGAKIS